MTLIDIAGFPGLSIVGLGALQFGESGLLDLVPHERDLDRTIRREGLGEPL